MSGKYKYRRGLPIGRDNARGEPKRVYTIERTAYILEIRAGLTAPVYRGRTILILGLGRNGLIGEAIAGLVVADGDSRGYILISLYTIVIV